MKKLTNDIREYLEEANPYDFYCAYENETDANNDIMKQITEDPEGLIDYFADILVELEYDIETEQNADVKADLDEEYAKVFDIIERIKKEGGHAA